MSVDWRKPRTKLLAGAAVVLLGTVLGLGVLLPPLSGPVTDGGRVEAGAAAQQDQPIAADPAGSLDGEDQEPLTPLVQEVTVAGEPAQIATDLEIPPSGADVPAVGTDGQPIETPDGSGGEAAETGTDAADTDGQTAAADETADESTTTTAPPPTTVAPTTVAPTTAPPAPPANDSAPAPGSNVRELYVDRNTGSGSNPGTKDRPFRRPIEATSIAEPGTTIYLRGGTYDTARDGALSIRRSGTAQNWIRIAPYPGERVELVGGGEYGSGFEFLGASYVELSGFVIRGRNDSIHGSGVFIKDGAHDIRVIGNQISNFGGAGISAVGSSRIHLEGNEVRDNAFRSHYQGSGITLFKLAGPVASGGNYSNIIRGNYVVHNYNAVPHQGDGRITDGNCIIMDKLDEVGYQGSTLIENNVCAENGGRGVHTYRSSNIVARNNTLYHNMWTSEVSAGRGELTAGEGRNIVFYNNLVFNRPGVASFINNNNQNTYFHNNYVASGPPPGEGNVVLSHGASHYFSSTNRGGPVSQWRPLPGSGLAGLANSDRQSATDYFGATRSRPGTPGAIEE
ncbi:MAG: right-handed parallel beta-helix repeat-containing protein [Actinomycetota bacterium]